MIYGVLNIGADQQEYTQPPKPDFYERNYSHDGVEKWAKDYWDGEKWYYVRGGKPSITQSREWREISTKEK
jgi:hypothetical protein